MHSSPYAIRDSGMILDRQEREYPLLLRDLPPFEKPREKLLREGPEALSTPELAAVIMVTGREDEDVLELASRIVRDYGERNAFSERDPAKLSKELDLPIVKACQLVAAGEIGRRFFGGPASTFAMVRSAKDVFEYAADMRSLPKEHLRGLYLNSRNRIIRDEIISIGTVSANLIHAREVYRTAIECNAAALILVHNHPSGDATPSSEDVAVTERLAEAGRIIGIRLIDHVVVAADSFASVDARYS